MEVNQLSSSSKLKRKPLSDCSNTRHNLQNPNCFNSNNNAVLSSDCTATRVTRSSSKLIPKTLSKIPKIPSSFDPVISGKKRKKKEEGKRDCGSDDSGKLRRKTGSDSAPSQPPTPLSSVGDIIRRIPGPSSALTQKQDVQTTNDKGKSVDATPTIQALSFSVSGISSHASRPPTVENSEEDERRIKDKGKMVIETPIIHESSPLTSQALQTSLSSAASVNYVFPRHSAIHSHQQDVQANKDNRTGQETLNVDAYGDIIHRRPGPSSALTQNQDVQTTNDKGKSVSDTCLASSTEHTPSSAVSGICGHDNRSPTTENREEDERRRKGKGKMVVETPIIHISPSLTSQTSSYSAASGNKTFQEIPNFDAYGDIFYRKSGPSPTLTIGRNPQTDKGKSVKTTPIDQASTYSKLSWSVSDNGDLICKPITTENPDLDEQRRKDKGKMVIETPIIHISSPVTSQTLETSESASSGNFYLPRPSAAHSHKQDAQLTQVKKDSLTIVQEKSNVDAFGPVTPSPLLPSSAFGADGQKKTGLMVNNQRRTSQRKNIGAGSISLPYSCPATKRTKKKGVDLDDGGGAGHSGSLTDPLPLCKKKQARNKKGNSIQAMSQDEVEKLKAYYADIDAFQLSEEEVSE